MKKTFLTVPLALVLALSILLGQPLLTSAQASPISGAIFTTDETGLLVDGNIYANALDVYLSGGPGPNAPPTAAGLPDGEYYFQVTDPPGKKLLSTDDVSNRSFRVDDGVIAEYLGTTHNWSAVEDIPGAIVIQLWPFGNTPNKGGVYKAWATPVEKYDPTDPHSFFGFIPRYSKTDNYKVRKVKPITRLTLDKFYDVNNNGAYDTDDYLITSWSIHVTDPLGVTNTYHTPRVIDVTGLPGTYNVTEDLPAGWEQTAVAVDGAYIVPPEITVTVEIANGETHSVLYGNKKEEIPAPPPPIRITLSISPVRVGAGNPISFYWNISRPPDVIPVRVELKVYNGAEETLYSGSDFPDDFERTITWTAKLPTGLWTVRVDYYYTYLDKPYKSGAEGSFRVHASNGN